MGGLFRSIRYAGKFIRKLAGVPFLRRTRRNFRTASSGARFACFPNFKWDITGQVSSQSLAKQLIRREEEAAAKFSSLYALVFPVYSFKSYKFPKRSALSCIPVSRGGCRKEILRESCRKGRGAAIFRKKVAARWKIRGRIISPRVRVDGIDPI